MLETTKNGFLEAFGNENAYTANGALSNATTGDLLVDQFAKHGSSRDRSLEEVFDDQASLWNENPIDAMKFAFYLRMVTRNTKMFGNETTKSVQKGQGNKDESLKRMLWMAINHPDEFYRNLWILPIVGSWKDIWKLMTMSDRIDRKICFVLIARGLADENMKSLVLKYMPRIRSNSKCKTEWNIKTNKLAKEFCSFYGISYEDYRKMKTEGKAHKFQRDICGGYFDDLDFSLIPGKALMTLMNDKFLEKHKLTKRYMEWLDSKETIPFNGYVYELVNKCMAGERFSTRFRELSIAERMTYDKQFDRLIETAKKDTGGINENVWCCLDTSGSMNVEVARGIRASDIANGLAIYFSTLNTGAFHKHVLAFDNSSKLVKLKGTFTEMIKTLPMVPCGGTNFQSAVDEIIRVRKKNPNIPLEDYPKTLLVVSDMQFNIHGDNVKTNYEALMEKLKKVFPEEFVNEMKFIWWYVTSSYNDFPSTIDDAGTYFFSGFDGAIVTILLGGEEEDKPKKLSMSEIIKKALNQEILSQIKF